jgi:cobalamin synthase
MLTLGDLPLVAVFVVVGIIVLAVGVNVLANLATGLTGDSLGAVNNGTKLLVNLFTNLPVLGIVIAGAVVIGVLISVFPTGGRGI